METPYTYLFIRKDLSLPQLIVQSSHAALEAGFRFDRPHATPHLVLIGVDDQEQLKQTADYLSVHDIEFEMFYEPDNGTGYTSIATRPLFGGERRPLRKYKLFKGERDV